MKIARAASRLISVFILLAAGCRESHNTITGLSAKATPGTAATATPTPRSRTATPTPGAAQSRNGTVTWASIQTTRALCPEITNQVGHSWPLWLSMEINNSSVLLRLAHEPPTHDPLADPPAVFRGRLSGDSISAVNTGILGGFACSKDPSVTPQTGGDLTATLSEHRISGEYTEIYGSGANTVTFLFRFHADL